MQSTGLQMCRYGCNVGKENTRGSHKSPVQVCEYTTTTTNNHRNQSYMHKHINNMDKQINTIKHQIQVIKAQRQQSIAEHDRFQLSLYQRVSKVASVLQDLQTPKPLEQYHAAVCDDSQPEFVNRMQAKLCRILHQNKRDVMRHRVIKAIHELDIQELHWDVASVAEDMAKEQTTLLSDLIVATETNQALQDRQYEMQNAYEEEKNRLLQTLLVERADKVVLSIWKNRMDSVYYANAQEEKTSEILFDAAFAFSTLETVISASFTQQQQQQQQQQQRKRSNRNNKRLSAHNVKRSLRSSRRASSKSTVGSLPTPISSPRM